MRASRKPEMSFRISAPASNAARGGFNPECIGGNGLLRDRTQGGDDAVEPLRLSSLGDDGGAGAGAHRADIQDVSTRAQERVRLVNRSGGVSEAISRKRVRTDVDDPHYQRVVHWCYGSTTYDEVGGCARTENTSWIRH